ncbi:MAG: peptidyl-alpha-hydroxyglycine alpha-amidating lyase family protein [SAR202 cluster bacterium]|nr:peptidyl-alpha-hydroxyglycine alpha-amidating lyase family protein [SAR202 cluster bacterium]|tara:strand:+ start:394 stop:1326 length:933 start_codon:yes stop_codon:yes gene_type:complete
MAIQTTGLEVSYGEYVFEHVPGWGKLPEGWEWNHVVGLGIDSKDRIYAYNRSAHPMIVLDIEGNVINHWGEGRFGSAHHLFIAPDDSLFTTDIGNHTVRKWSPEGELRMTLGTPDQPAERLSGEPFNRPTDVAMAADGSLYITDGYGNARVHHYTGDGELIKSWGELGSGPGQFVIPHSVCLDAEGLVYVADRENSRVQVFTPDGEYIREWKGVHRPDHVWLDADQNMYVAELGQRQGLSPDAGAPSAIAHPSGVKVMNRDGQWLGGWGMSTETPGDIIAAHSLSLDSNGDLYVGETLDGARVQKFVRKK